MFNVGSSIVRPQPSGYFQNPKPKIQNRIFLASQQAYKPNFVIRLDRTGNHSSRLSVTQKLERPTRKRRLLSGQPFLTFPYLVLHREEFTQPPLLPKALVRSYRTISPITRSIWDFGFGILDCSFCYAIELYFMNSAINFDLNSKHTI